MVGSDALLEFGTRRAQEMSAAVWERAAYIGGFDATSNVRAGKYLEFQLVEPMPMRWFNTTNDYDAFKAYAETHHDCVFLVDT